MDDHPIESAKDAILKLIHGVENPFKKEEKEDSDAMDKDYNSANGQKNAEPAEAKAGAQSRQDLSEDNAEEGDEQQIDVGDAVKENEVSNKSSAVDNADDEDSKDSQEDNKESGEKTEKSQHPIFLEMMKKSENKGPEPKPEPRKGVVDTLKDDHKKVKGLFKEFSRSDSMQEKFELGNTITRELTIHSKLEEEIVYKAVKSLTNEQGAILEGYEEHFIVDSLILEIRSFTSVDETYQAKMKVLTDLVEHHIKEEEHSILPKVKDYPEQDELTEEFNERRDGLQATEDLWPELSINGDNSKKSSKKPADRAKAKPGVKAKPAAKAKAKPAAKAKAKPAAKAKAKPAAKAKAKPAAKAKAKPAAKAKAKPAVKAKAKPAVKAKTGGNKAAKPATKTKSAKSNKVVAKKVITKKATAKKPVAAKKTATTAKAKVKAKTATKAKAGVGAKAKPPAKAKVQQKSTAAGKKSAGRKSR